MGQKGGLWGHTWETGGGPDSSLYRTLREQFTPNEEKDFEVIFPRTEDSKIVSFCIVGVREIRLLSQLRSERSMSQCSMDILLMNVSFVNQDSLYNMWKKETSHAELGQQES